MTGSPAGSRSTPAGASFGCLTPMSRATPESDAGPSGRQTPGLSEATRGLEVNGSRRQFACRSSVSYDNEESDDDEDEIF